MERIKINSDASKIKEWDNRYQLGFCIKINDEEECKIIRIRENHINVAELKGMMFALKYVFLNYSNLNNKEMYLYSDNMFVIIFLRQCLNIIANLTDKEKYILLKHEIFKPKKNKNTFEFIKSIESLKKQKFYESNYLLKLIILIQEQNNSIYIKWIPRRENQTADKLSKFRNKYYDRYSIDEI